MRGSSGPARTRRSAAILAVIAATGVAVAFTSGPDGPGAAREVGAEQQVNRETILKGRQLVLEHGCGGCHGGDANPAAPGFLAGITSPAQEFPIGACAEQPGAEPCWMTRPRNLTPDNTTGLGRFSERQIFNALRFGLRPGETADVEITSSTPGEGNFPLSPKYLAPPMPWNSWRHMPDADLWAIAAYLKHGLKPVSNQVEDSEGPPDFWASAYTEETFGSYPAPPFPAAAEQEPVDRSLRDRVLAGRQQVLEHACGDCHGGFQNPNAEGFLAGASAPGQIFPVGPCLEDPSAPCFMMRPRNLTPHPEAGTGRYTERQIFNAIRHGLRPSGTPDRDITPETFPADPDFLGPGMIWFEVRHMSDADIRAIATYLKHGLKPVNRVMEESDRNPDGWGTFYTDEEVGTFPAPPFPTVNEVGG